MLQRFLDPAVLAGISGLDLVAKTVVDGFVNGLHRSPDFGFSQEFAEYRAYSPGDDLRHVDWNVFARTERAYLKRYRGETNSILTVLLDASNSMKFSSHSVSKMDYARFTAASLFYLAIQNQRDAAGLIVFDDEIRNYIRPSTRQGQLHRLLSGLEQAEPHARTDFAKPLESFSAVPAPPRNRRLHFRFLRFAGTHRADHRAVALPRQRSRAVSRSRSQGNPAGNRRALDADRSGNAGAHRSHAGIRARRIPQEI